MGRKRSNIQIDIDLQPKQNELWDLYEFGKPTRIGAGGSRGGSKSISADYIMLMRRIKYPNTNGLFIMKVYQDMIDIHLRPLFDRFHGLEDFFDKKEMLLTLPNGSYIRFLSGDSLATFQQRKGRGFADVMVDQSELFTEEELKFLYTINRSVDPTITPKTLLCFNPGGTSHTYNRRIFLEKYFKDNEKEEDYAFVQIFGWDNAYWALKPLAEDGLTIEDYHKWDDKKRFEYFITCTEYGKNLDQLPDSQRKAELLGDFYVFEGMFFSDIRTDIHLLKEYEMKPDFKTIGGLDYGNVTVLEILQRDYEGTIVAADECYLENYSNPTDRANEIADFLIERKLNNLRIICDTDMNSSQISNVGFDKKPIDIFRSVFSQRMGKNAPRLEFVSKSAGSLDRNKTYRAICNEAVKNYLAIHDGKAKLYFSPRVKHLYDTMTQLIYDRKDPSGLDFDRSRLPKIDHAYDAAKYSFMSLITPKRQKEKDPDADKYARKRFIKPRRYASDYTF